MNTIQGAMTTIEYDDDFKITKLGILSPPMFDADPQIIIISGGDMERYIAALLDDLESVREELFQRTKRGKA